MSFQWIAVSQSCEICLALEAYHEEEPQRPHPNCDCEIFEEIFEEKQGFRPGSCWGEVSPYDGWDTYVDGVVVKFVKVIKICADGDQVEGTIEIEQTLDDWMAAWIDDPNGEAWHEYHEEMWAGIDDMCEHELEDECTTFVDPTP
jgi:hypothetical protein